MEINVSDNELEDVSHINNFTTPSIATIDVSNNDLKSLQSFSTLMYVTEINASSNDISDNNSILAIVQNCRNLKMLNIQDNDIKKSTIAQIREVAE